VHGQGLDQGFRAMVAMEAHQLAVQARTEEQPMAIQPASHRLSPARLPSAADMGPRLPIVVVMEDLLSSKVITLDCQ
jgi:hypothetical protein